MDRSRLRGHWGRPSQDGFAALSNDPLPQMDSGRLRWDWGETRQAALTPQGESNEIHPKELTENQSRI